MIAGKTKDQIARIDSKGAFVEARSCLFEPKKEGKLGKVMFGFVEYDTQSNKQKKAINIFIDIPKILELTDDIRLGFIKKDINAEKQRAASAGDKYCKAVWTDLGGTPASTLAQKGKARADGKSESRIMEIIPAAKEGYVILRAKRGPGILSDKGIISPDYSAGNNAFETASVLCSISELRQLAKMIDIAITGYEVRKWMNGGHDFVYTNESPYQATADNGYYQNKEQYQNNIKYQQNTQQNSQRQEVPNQQNSNSFDAPLDNELSDTGFNPFAIAQ